MEQCANCDKQGDEKDKIRLCAACNTVGYCSRECQKQHWKQHKSVCKAKQAELQDKNGAAERNAVSSKKVDIKRKGETTAKTTQNGAMASSGPLKTCLNCQRQSEDIKYCGKCLVATYCSLDCQRSHWRIHKSSCNTIETVTTDGFRRTQEREEAENRARREREQTTRRSAMEYLSSLLGNTRLTPRTLTWEEARSRARRIYPGKRIVDLFRELQHDAFPIPLAQDVVALVKIKGVYPHFFRHGRCLEDSKGMTSFVLFHVEGNPMPYFRYEQLEEGNFLCYEHAHMHFFMDGTVGFRIDEAENIHIMEP